MTVKGQLLKMIVIKTFISYAISDINGPCQFGVRLMIGTIAQKRDSSLEIRRIML
jgi:hypothetical protein